MAAGRFPRFERAAFNHVLNGAQGNAQTEGCLPGAEIFGIGHDFVFTEITNSAKFYPVICAKLTIKKTRDASALGFLSEMPSPVG